MYIHETSVHNTKAAENVVPLIKELFHPSSVLDVGCGIGTWLKIFKKNGIENILGIDTQYVNKAKLFANIAKEEFLILDLSKPFDLNLKFDLIICLEVAEHLTASCADSFVDSLIKHADTIIFSAAVPGQWGQNHLNEQWIEYWIALFNDKGYKCYDLIRPLIWNNKNVEWWYKQNMIIFSKKTLQLKTKIIEYQSIIHPQHFIQKIHFIDKQLKELANAKSELRNWEESNQGVRKHWRSFCKSLLKKFSSI